MRGVGAPIAAVHKAEVGSEQVTTMMEGSAVVIGRAGGTPASSFVDSSALRNGEPVFVPAERVVAFRGSWGE